jgi:outer membrane protein assembly factor BamE (lipoprotein component of BamABCDE complex)
MNKSLKVILIVLSVLLVGCATAHRLNQVDVGMPKQQAIKILGQPASSRAQRNTEYLTYYFYQTRGEMLWAWWIWPRARTPYFVRMVDGKVESYGELGDFDSTKVPEVKSTIDLNLKK